MKKVYIRYGKPERYADVDDDPPVSKIWDDGKKPSAKMADGLTFVYDETDAGQMTNEREWDGKE